MGNLFCISDLHLSLGSDKPMDVFKGWENYVDRIKANWTRVVKDDDTVVIAGDTSWAISFNEALPDFAFIHSLPGEKIFIKGNHDFWWSTASKINSFFSENGFNDMHILHNNCYCDGNIAICGTRGWLYDGGKSDEKVNLRECGRLQASIGAAQNSGSKPIVFLHYPPAYGEFQNEQLVEVLKNYKIDTLYYGHIHGLGRNNSLNEFDGINMKLISCDTVDFTPFYIDKFDFKKTVEKY